MTLWQRRLDESVHKLTEFLEVENVVRLMNQQEIFLIKVWHKKFTFWHTLPNDINRDQYRYNLSELVNRIYGCLASETRWTVL